MCYQSIEGLLNRKKDFPNTLASVRVSPKNVINRTPIKIIGNKKRSALAAIYYFDSPCYCYGYGGASDPDSIRHCVTLCLHPYTERRVSLWEFYRVRAVGKRIILLSFYEVVWIPAFSPVEWVTLRDLLYLPKSDVLFYYVV